MNSISNSNRKENWMAKYFNKKSNEIKRINTQHHLEAQSENKCDIYGKKLIIKNNAQFNSMDKENNNKINNAPRSLTIEISKESFSNNHEYSCRYHLTKSSKSLRKSVSSIERATKIEKDPEKKGQTIKFKNIIERELNKVNALISSENLDVSDLKVGKTSINYKTDKLEREKSLHIYTLKSNSRNNLPLTDFKGKPSKCDKK